MKIKHQGKEGGMPCYTQSLCLQFSPGWQWPGGACLPAVGWPLWKSRISRPVLSGQVSISWSQLALLPTLLVKWAQCQGTKAAGPLLLPASRCEPPWAGALGREGWCCHGNGSKKDVSSSRSVWSLFCLGNVVKKKRLCGDSDLCVNVCLVCFECITSHWTLLVSPAGQIWGLVDLLGDVVMAEDQVTREVPGETIQCKPSRTE